MVMAPFSDPLTRVCRHSWFVLIVVNAVTGPFGLCRIWTGSGGARAAISFPVVELNADYSRM